MKNLKILLLLAVTFVSGCEIYDANKASDNYYLNPDKDLANIGRVTLIELANESSFPAISSDATEALSQAIQKKSLFGLSAISQSDSAWRSLQLDMDSSYTLTQLSAIRDSLNSDALLIGTVTTFKPYPHMTIGLRLKMLDLTDGQLIWATEQIWDSTDKTVENRIKSYYDGNIFRSATLGEQLGTISSLKFIKFVAHEVSQTMKPKK